MFEEKFSMHDDSVQAVPRFGGHKESITDIRLAVSENGYRPVPISGIHMNVKHPGKQPVMAAWQQKCANADPEMIRSWMVDQAQCINTGMMTGTSGGIVAADIDVLVPEVADEIADLAAELLGASALQRIGKAPKTLIVYRVGNDFRKVKTPAFIMPDGTTAQVEFLAEGQQFVAFGTHPDTRKPYQWVGASPVDVPADDLPLVDRDAAEAFIDCAAQVLRNHGGVPKLLNGKSKPAAAAAAAVKPSKAPGGAPVGDNFFANVNVTALANLEQWVPSLFPGIARYHAGTGAYRVRSDDLGRDYEEDLSFHPDGIVDYGPEKTLTAINSVMEFGGAADAKDAAHWLCEKMKIDPVSLGWTDLKAKAQRKAPEPQAKADHAADREATENNDPNWYSLCQVSTKGTPLGNHANIMLALRLDPAWAGVVRYDEMARVIMLMKPLPRIPEQKPNQIFKPRPWQDNDATVAQEWFQLAGLRSAAREAIYYAIEARARENTSHPVINYLDALVWDGVPRLDRWLPTYIGTENNAYTQTIGRLFLISAVARIFDPGCKVDYMLIFEGEQGDSKSTACKVMGDKWFSDNMPHDVSGKDASQHLRGKWFIEVAEMHAMSKSETTALKAFLTRTVEVYRPSYGRAEVYEPRQCVFIGTTNRDDYLTDETGARRFWPVRVGTIDLDGLTQDRDQLFAEAVHLYRNGAQWYPSREFEAEHIRPQQEARYDVDAWDEPIMKWLEKREPVTLSDGTWTARATAMEVAREALNIDTGRVDKVTTNRIRKVLTSHGWHKDGPRDGGGNRLWYPPTFPRRKR